MATDQILSFPGGYQVGQPAPAPVLFARPSSDTPRKPSPYEALLDKLIRSGQSGQGGGTSEEDFSPTPFDTYTYLRNKAAGGPSQMDMQAGEAGINAQSAQDLLERLRGIPTSQREMLTAPDYPALNLPSPPQRHKAQPEPVSSLAAGLLGLVSPQYAGQFGAAATHGALEANERQYGDDQQKYAQDFQRMQVMHADDLRRINAQNEIANENKGIAYANSIQREKGLREEATAANNASRLTGISKYLSDIAPKADEASQYGVQAEDLLTQIKMQQQQREKERDRQNETLGHAITARAHVEGAHIAYDRALDVQGMRNAEQEKNIAGRHSDVVYRADKALEAAKARASAAGSRALADPTLNLRMRSLQENVRTQREHYRLIFNSTDPKNNYGQPRTPNQTQELAAQQAQLDAASKELQDFTASIVTKPPKYGAPGPKGIGLPAGAKVVPLDEFLRGK